MEAVARENELLASLMESIRSVSTRFRKEKKNRQQVSSEFFEILRAHTSPDNVPDFETRKRRCITCGFAPISDGKIALNFTRLRRLSGLNKHTVKAIFANLHYDCLKQRQSTCAEFIEVYGKTDGEDLRQWSFHSPPIEEFDWLETHEQLDTLTPNADTSPQVDPFAMGRWPVASEEEEAAYY